jgi:SAM-dependent methyltransferase
MESDDHSTRRFSNRVAHYVKYRPGYPDELIQTLKARAGLNSESIVADIGSGTGISTELFLRLGCPTYGVEPNADMRQAAESRFAGNPRFHSINATAEQTSLADGSVDLVAAGQAFHWFDVDKTRSEFARILRHGGFVALFWNSRRTDSTPFLTAYEHLLFDYATDYQQVNHTNIEPAIFSHFFGGSHYEYCSFPTFQEFDYEGLRGRLLSSSYAPAAGHPRHEPMLLELERIFREHESNGRVRIEYDTELHLGQLR